RSSGGRCGPTGRTWPRRSTPPAAIGCPTPARWWTASTSPRSSTRGWTGSGGKITRAYKAKLTQAQRKEFRSLMWEFRRDPEGLTEAEKAKPEVLFGKLPRLRALYEIRVRFRRIFDTAPDRRQALRELVWLWMDVLEHFPALDAFIRTFEAWQDE